MKFNPPSFPPDLRRDLVLLTVLLTLLFGFALGSRSLWSPDEGRYAEIPREMVTSGDYLTPRLNGVKYFEKPPLVYWIESASIRLLNQNEWALRLPLALTALAGCIAIYVAGRNLFNRRTGLLAAGILATSPLYYTLARTLTLDMTLSVLLGMGLLAFLMGVREPPGPRRRWLLWAFYAITALAVLTKGLVGILLPGLIIFCWVLLINDWRLLTKIYLPSGMAIFLVIAVPWHVMVARSNPEFTYFYFVHEHFLRYLTKIHSRYEPPWFFIPVLIFGLFPWIAFLAQALRAAWPAGWARRAEQPELLFLLLWAGLIFIFFSESDSKLATYILPIFPPLSLLLAHWLDARWEHTSAPGLRTGLVLLLVAAVFLAAAFVILPQHLSSHHNVAHVANQLGSGLYVFCLMLLAVGLLPWVIGRHRFSRAFSTLLVANALLWSFVSLELPKFDDDYSVKTLAMKLRPHLKPEDDVISYHDYYQDLPFYLQHRVTVTGYQGELAFGIHAEPRVRQWMINDAEFLRRWKSQSQAYMFASHKDYENLAASGRGTFHLLATSNNAVLLSNH
jgi:4-amino-4-deoxy-L-arabinose transferase-like glycosyltransferase